MRRLAAAGLARFRRAMEARLDRRIYHPALEPYLAGLLPARHPVLREMEARAARERFPIVGPVEGQLLYMLTRLTRARSVFEMGSGFGYSTAWFAMGVRENGGGEVVHVVWNERLSGAAKDYLGRLGLAGLVRFRVGEAVEELRRTDREFDIIFNDIDKEGYPASLPVIKQHLRPGGLLLVDNVLWRGRVFTPPAPDAATTAIRRLTAAISADPEFVSTLLSLRDGILLAQRR